MEGIETAVVEQPIVEASVETPVITAEQVAFEEQMQYAFMDDPPAVTQPIPLADGDDESISTASEAAPEVAAPIVPDYSAFVKETFGVDTIEEAKAKWEELKASKAEPLTAKEIEFADEESKRIHELLRSGNKKEVTQYLKQQEQLEGVESMTGEQKLKLYIKMQNPKFDNELIDDEYKSLYTIDENDFDSLEPLAQKKQLIKLEQRLDKDVESAEQFFANYKKEIKLPELQIQAATIDEDYEAYKASNASVSERVNNVLIPAIKSLKETDVNLGFKVQDPNNKMEFDISLAPTTEAFEKARQNLLSFDSFIDRVCYDKDGIFLPQNAQKLILLNDNFDSYAQSIARQAVNAERVRTIAKEAPNAGSGGRDFNTAIEKSDFQKYMDAAFT